jgi:hypothetical protein
MTNLLYSSNISILAIADKKQVLSKDMLPSIRESMIQELKYFPENHTVSIIPDIEKDFKSKYAIGGFKYLQGFAASHKSDVIIILEYKKGARSILAHLFISDGQNMSKNDIIKYTKGVRTYLPKLISSKILKLLIETGQLNEKNRYL